MGAIRRCWFQPWATPRPQYGDVPFFVPSWTIPQVARGNGGHWLVRLWNLVGCSQLVGIDTRHLVNVQIQFRGLQR